MEETPAEFRGDGDGGFVEGAEAVFQGVIHPRAAGEVTGAVKEKKHQRAEEKVRWLAEAAPQQQGHDEGAGGGAGPFAGTAFEQEPRSAPHEGVGEEGWQKESVKTAHTLLPLKQSTEDEAAAAEVNEGDEGIHAFLTAGDAGHEGPDGVGGEAEEAKAEAAVQKGADHARSVRDGAMAVNSATSATRGSLRRSAHSQTGWDARRCPPDSRRGDRARDAQARGGGFQIRDG